MPDQQCKFLGLLTDFLAICKAGDKTDLSPCVTLQNENAVRARIKNLVALFEAQR